MKFKKDVALALATVAGALVALFAIFVTIPVWFEAVVITLTTIGLIATISEIVKAHRASYDEELGKRTYKFPVRAFVIGTLILVAIAAIILLSLKRLYGFALIPLVVLLAVLLVVAFLKKLRTMKWIVGLLLAILVIALIGYYTSAIVHEGVNLNPGISVEAETSETDVPETNAPETEAPETNAPETDIPETNAPETDVPETNAPETNAPETDVPETNAPETEAPETNAPETNAPETDVPETNAPETNAPETEAPETEAPETNAPETETPEVETPVIEYTNVHLKVYLPKVINYGEPIRVVVDGINAHELEFEYDGVISVKAISDTELAMTVYTAIDNVGNVDYTVNDEGHIVIMDSEAKRKYTIEVIELETETTKPEIKDEDENLPEINVPEVETPDTDIEDDYIPVVVKINAPETIAYAKPITITLEGCKAENLRYGNEDFLSIVIVSDSEVEITLIGVVNESGEVEFVPASGYITVTDSVSGEHVTIEIVENDEIVVEPTVPEIQEPEIEDENDEIVEDKPVVEVEKPEIETEPEDDYTPVVVKINAPETMVYAEPIIITLEGINAADLKFSNEDFLSIVIISDSEVEVTLIGIVNDAGEVEFVPAAGYITVTDSVSGVHAIIEIVE